MKKGYNDPMRYSPAFILKTFLVAIVAGFVTGYALFQAQNLLHGPQIALAGADANVGGEIAQIRGTAKNVTDITFNNRRIYTDKDGNFSEKFVLSEGYNVVRIAAADKFGRTVDRTIEMVYASSPNGTPGTLSFIDTPYDGKKN